MTRAPDYIFCDIVAGQLPASVVFEDARVLAFMDLAQTTEGHTLVVPRAHFDDMRDFDPTTGAAVMNAVAAVTARVTAAFEPEGLTIRHNIGEAGGQDVFHAHFHVYARYQGDGLHRPYQSAPSRPSRAELDRLATTIRMHLPDRPT